MILALGMVTTPANAVRRQVVRTTMLHNSKSLRRGRVAFRFVVGCGPAGGCATEMKALHDDMVALDALDGSAVSEHGPHCACVEKTSEWFKYALRKWPQASFYAKTEDDTYTHIDALLLELVQLGRRPNLAYGKWGTCAMPDTPTQGVHVPPPKGQDFRRWGKAQSKIRRIGYQVMSSFARK